MYVFLLRLKCNYEKLHKNSFNFRLVVTDFSWALIHSTIEMLNSMSVKEYAMTVFKLANNSLETDKQYSWLVSCISHTMKRFVASIKQLKIKDFLQTYSCFCFSLLANHAYLDLASDYYKAICTIFLSPYVSDELINAKTKIKLSLMERPETFDYFAKILPRHEA